MEIRLHDDGPAPGPPPTIDVPVPSLWGRAQGTAPVESAALNLRALSWVRTFGLLSEFDEHPTKFSAQEHHSTYYKNALPVLSAYRLRSAHWRW